LLDLDLVFRTEHLNEIGTRVYGRWGVGRIHMDCPIDDQRAIFGVAGGATCGAEGEAKENAEKDRSPHTTS
jgi:hypothetical protein